MNNSSLDNLLEPDTQETIAPKTPYATGFLKGLSAGAQNFDNIFDPEKPTHIETQGFLAGLGEGLGNPVNIATMFVPGGVIVGAAAGAVGNTLTDYLSKRASDEMTEYSWSQLGVETLTGAALGFAGKAVAPLLNEAKPLASKGVEALKGIPSKIKGKEVQTSVDEVENIISKMDSVPPEVAPFISKDALRTNEFAKQGILANEDTFINPTNPIQNLSKEEIDIVSKKIAPPLPELSNEIDNILTMPNITENETNILRNSLTRIEDTPELQSYLDKINLKDEYTDVRNGLLLSKTYGTNPEELAFKWKNLAAHNQNILINNMENAFKADKELKPFMKDINNKQLIYRSLYNEWDDALAIEKYGVDTAERIKELSYKAAELIRKNNQAIVKGINSRGNIGYIETRAGRQMWLKENLNNVSVDEFHNDLMRTSMIEGKDGWRVPTLEDAKDIKNKLTIEKNAIMNAVPVSKSRIIHFKNADAAFAMDAKYGGDMDMLNKVISDSFSGSKTMTNTQMFGVNPNSTIEKYQNLIPVEMRSKINNLKQTIMPPADGSMEIAKAAIASANLVQSGFRVAKSALNPFYQIEFAVTDLPSVLGNALHTYGANIFKDIKNTGWKELKGLGKELEKFSKLPHGLNRNFNKYEAMSEMAGFTKTIEGWTNNIFSLDSVANGSHFIDGQIRKFQAMLTALGESQRIKAGGTIPGVDRKFILEAIPKGKSLPDGDLLIDKSLKLKEKGQIIKADEYANAGAAINSYFQTELTKTNPNVYRNMSNIPKGSIANLWGLRAVRWVQNMYLNLQAPMLKSIYKNFGKDWNKVFASAGGLFISSVPVGLAGTLFEYLHKPDDFKDENAFTISLAKNIGLALVTGSLYLPSLMSYTVAKDANRLYKAFQEEDKDKIWKALGQGSWPIQALNVAINGVD